MNFLLGPGDLVKGDRIEITDPQTLHHLDVARAYEGPPVRFVLKDSLIFAKPAGRGVFLIISRERMKPRPRVKVHVMAALIRPKAFDLLLTRCVELGAASFTAIACSRSGVFSNPTVNRMNRWKKLILQSCGQCQRHDIPPLHGPVDLENAVNKARGMRWILDTDEAAGAEVVSLPADVKEISVFNGPEGGFDGREIQIFSDAGACRVFMGPLVLRAENAAAAFLAGVQALGNSWNCVINKQ